jgi:hypothetical protein
MKNVTILIISIFTLSLSFGQPLHTNLMDKAREISTNFNQKHFQALKTNDIEQFKLDSVIIGFFDDITDSLVVPLEEP